MSTTRSLRSLLAADAVRDGSASPFTALVRSVVTVRFQAVVLARLAAASHARLPFAAVILKYLNSVITGCDVASAARIGPGLRLYHPSGVVIGPEVVLGTNCTIQQHVTLGHGAGGSPTLGDDVFIGPGAVLLGGISIGDGSIVGANSVVLRDVPAGEVWAGVPAKFVKRLAA